MTKTEFNQEHEQVFDMLPWYVNQTLSPEEDARVEAHLQQCLICKKELALLEQVNQSIDVEEEMEASMQRTLGALNQRILEAMPEETPNDTTNTASNSAAASTVSLFSRSKRAYQQSPQGVKVTLLAQAAALVLAVGVLFVDDPSKSQAAYTTLTSAEKDSKASHSMLKVIFNQESSFANITKLLKENQLEIVQGPSAAGAYVLSTGQSMPKVSNLVSQLLKDDRITFIQASK